MQTTILNPYYFNKCFALHDRHRKNKPPFRSPRSRYYSERYILSVPDYPRGCCNPWRYKARYLETVLPEGVKYDARYSKYFVTVDLDGVIVYHTPYGSGLNPEEISPNMTVPKAVLDSPIVRHYKEIQPVDPSAPSTPVPPELLIEQEEQEGDDDYEGDIDFARPPPPFSQQQTSVFTLPPPPFSQ